MNKLAGLKPERVFYYFEELSKIPRCSNDEKRVSDYLIGLGQSLGFETIQDDMLNVIIKKPGTKGYESKTTVVLQGHMDMVCEKRDNSNHDFSKDAIKFSLQEDFVMAEDTTLGADNGIAVAMCLAILEDKDISHPPLEVLVTTSEETGLTGAAALSPEHIQGRILINIDSEEEGTILVSCAGGQRDEISIPLALIEADKNKESYTVKVSGLQGGHSGMEINKGRGNSNKILGRTLHRLGEKVDFDLYYIDGGSLPNAIPRYAYAKILLNSNDLSLAKEIIKEIDSEIKQELLSSDKGLNISLESNQETIDKVFSGATKTKIITALMIIPTGVQSMSQNIEGLVESSINLGVVKTKEDLVTIECSLRSSVGSLKQHIAKELELIATTLNSNYETSSAYPAWEYKEDSYIRKVFLDTYRELYNKDMKIEAIHAGLECGLFSEKFDDMDMISFGPNMAGVHAPGEKLSISSTERTYDLLVKVLENI